MPVTPRVSSDSLKSGVLLYELEDLVAGANVEDRPVFVAHRDLEFTKLRIVGHAAATGIDDGNTSVWVFKAVTGDADADPVILATVTFNADNAFPDARKVFNVPVNPSVINNFLRVPEGSLITLSITNGDNANLPACLIQAEYIVDEDL